MINSKINIMPKYILTMFIGLILSNMASYPSYGQDMLSQEGTNISFNVGVVNATTLISGKTKILLWGVEKINTDAIVFHLKIRNSLENKIGNKNILCNIKENKAADIIKAQCINDNEEDLSLFLLQQGYVSANREAIHKSIYEEPYLSAERNAQANKVGIWESEENALSSSMQSKNFLMATFILIFAFILALGALSFHIMRGFARVVDIQNQSINLAKKERTLKDKEKYIIASMLNAEIRSNKAKIEAYITIYDETLQVFNDPNKALRYQKTGDIVQKQPALDRSIFDGNTNKLDLLGSQLSSHIIHYYARIKTTPDYIEIMPDMPQEEAKKIIETVISNTKKLEKVSNDITDLFVQYALIKRLE